jgi:nucleoside phosphorylase
LITKLRLIKQSASCYANDTTLLVVTGVGAQQTQKSLHDIYQRYAVTYAVNIGTCGDCGGDTPIGSLIEIGSVKYLKNPEILLDPSKESLTTLDKHTTSGDVEGYVDMEAYAFVQVAQKFLDNDRIAVYKVVSDHCDQESLGKNFVSKIIANSLEINGIIRKIIEEKPDESRADR